MRRASWWIAAVLLLVAGPVQADDPAPSASYRALIDRVELEPATLTGFRLRVELSALALQGGRAGGDVGIDGALSRGAGGGTDSEERRRESAAQPRHRCRSDVAGLPGARVHSRLKMVCPSALG